jgi:MFS family permease
VRAWIAGNGQVLGIAVSTVIVMAGQGITSPILPLYAREFGVSTAVVGLTITAFALARLIVNLPAGALADTRGRRMLLIGGPLILAVGMAGSGLAVGIADLLVWRFVAGVGSAVYMTGAQLYILDVSPPDRWGRNISYNSGALLLGLSFGPAIGGVASEMAGLRAPFFLVGAMALGAGIYGFLRLPEPVRHAETGATDERTAGSVWRLFGSRNLLLVSAVSLVVFATRAGRETLVPLMAIDTFGMSEGQLGGVLGAVALTGFFLVGPAGQAADRFGRKATIVPAGAVATAGVVAIWLAGSTAWFVAALWVLGIGTSLTGPSQYAFAAGAVSEADRGRALGLYRSAGDLGFLAAPPLLGALADATSIDQALVVNAVALGLTILVFAVLAREQRNEPKAGHRPTTP